MKFYFSPKTSLLCLGLAGLMLRASYWQWERHEEKLQLIEQLEARLQTPPQDFSSLKNLPPEELIHRRVWLTGSFDFEHEMLLRNRRLGNEPGVYVLTPFRVLEEGNEGKGEERAILVSRGFLPVAHAEKGVRKKFEKDAPNRFMALLKESQPRRFLAPADPPSGAGQTWVDAWLRVNLPEMEKQLPYKLFPVYGELMPESSELRGAEDEESLSSQIVRSEAGREEIFMLPSDSIKVGTGQLDENMSYPVPVYDAIVPAGRHFGYIFEWAFMAMATLLVGLLLQLRPPAILRSSTTTKTQQSDTR